MNVVSSSTVVPDTTNLLPFARQMSSIRQSYRALQDGDVQHGLVIDDALSVAKATATISLGGLSATYGDAPFAVSATASLGLGVSFSRSRCPADADRHGQL
jgi:hypothetical protein